METRRENPPALFTGDDVAETIAGTGHHLSSVWGVGGGGGRFARNINIDIRFEWISGLYGALFDRF